MNFFTRAFDLVSVTLIISLIFSPSVAAPHAGGHRRKHHGHGVTSASPHSGSGLRFNVIDGNRTNHDLYLLPIQARQLDDTASTVTSVTVHQSTATTADLRVYIVQPHQRVHQTVHAMVPHELPNIGYAAMVSSSASAESSPPRAAFATLVPRDYGDAVQTASLQPALLYTFHLPRIEGKTAKGKKAPSPPSRRLPSLRRKTKTITQTTTLSRAIPSVSLTSASTASEGVQIQTSIIDRPSNNYEGYGAPKPQSSESRLEYQPSAETTSSVISSESTPTVAEPTSISEQSSTSTAISSIEVESSTATSSSTQIPDLGSGAYTSSSSSATQTFTSLQSSAGYGYNEAPTSATPQSSMTSAYDDISTSIPPQSSMVPGYGDEQTSATSESSTIPAYSDIPISMSLSSELPLYQSTSTSLESTSSTDIASPTVVPPPPISYAEGSSVIPPRVLVQNLLGVSSNEPSSQYIKLKIPPNIKLPDNLLTVGVNNALSTSYGIAPDTGSIPINDTTKPLIADLKSRPHLSRDGGKGGYLNGQKLFLFCDTGSYMPPTTEKYGDFLGFVSSSAAIDIGMKAAYGQPIVLEDGIGEWSDDVGRMRGFAPLTEGEQSYNLIMQGKGQRYAIWPESSLIPLNYTHALIYAPIVYIEVDWATRHAVFTYTGSTLLTISTGPDSGPHAERIVDKIFKQEEVEWGTIAGFRTYGPSGIGGNDGRVYVIGKVEWGLLLGRVDVNHVTDRGSYEYWNGDNWTKDMPDRSSRAYFLPGPYMDGDLIYSPAHLTFIWVYLNPYADNTFYFRYLQADTALRPAGAPGGDSNGDIAENLVKYQWSEEQVLFKASGGPTGKYIYAGGVHQGYFDKEDISNGGKKMLLSWTVPTGDNPASVSSEYLHLTAYVEFV